MKEPGLQEQYAWERFQTPSLLFPGDPRMLYLGIDQHKQQLTVNLRGEDGLVVLATPGIRTDIGNLGEMSCGRPTSSGCQGGGTS